MKNLSTYISETKGDHDNSKTYDDLYSDVEKYLNTWGAGPVFGWKGDNGIAFSVSKGKNVKPNDWIVIVHNRQHDDLTIMLSKYGEGDPETASNVKDMVYAGQEPDVINDMLGI